MSSDLVIIIPDELATQEQCRQLLVALDRRIIGKVDKMVDENLALLLTENKLENPTSKQLSDLRIMLNNELHRRVITKIYTAVALSPLQQAEIVKWFTRSIGVNIMLISFRVDNSLIGGVVIQTQRQRLDYSVLSGTPKGRQYLKRMVASR